MLLFKEKQRRELFHQILNFHLSMVNYYEREKGEHKKDTPCLNTSPAFSQPQSYMFTLRKNITVVLFLKVT
jgi:hypothetical protein